MQNSTTDNLIVPVTFENKGFVPNDEENENNSTEKVTPFKEAETKDNNEHFDCCGSRVKVIQTIFMDFWNSKRNVIFKALKAILLLAYIGYVAYAMYYKFGGEPEYRLLICSVIGLTLISGFWCTSRYNHQLKQCNRTALVPFCQRTSTGRMKWHLRWILKVLVFTLIVVYTVVKAVRHRPDNLIPLGGITLYIGLFYVTSVNPAKVDWHPVFWGFALQFIFALIFLETTLGYNAFVWLGKRLKEFLQYSDVGAIFVFGSTFKEHQFAFKAMPIVIFMATMINVLYYLGVIPFIVKHGGNFLGFCMGTRPVETFSAVGNILLGMTALPIILRNFLEDLSNSELHAILTGGFATIAGSIMGAYINFGVPANHLLTASVMSAPAALAISKLTYPELSPTEYNKIDYSKMEKSKDKNIFEAATTGATVSAKLVAAIVVNVIAFLSILQFVNVSLTWFGERVGIENLTLEFISSYVFYPIAYFMGADVPDCRKVATLVAKKTFTNEYIAYADLAKMIHNREELGGFESNRNWTGTWWTSNDDVTYNNGTHNVTLLLGIISERSEVVSTYALCGFSNFGSMGIALGTFSALAPSRTTDVTNMILRSMIAGNAACFLTASIAGFYTNKGILREMRKRIVDRSLFEASTIKKRQANIIHLMSADWINSPITCSTVMTVVLLVFLWMELKLSKH